MKFDEIVVESSEYPVFYLLVVGSLERMKYVIYDTKAVVGSNMLYRCDASLNILDTIKREKRGGGGGVRPFLNMWVSFTGFILLAQVMSITDILS